MKDIDEQLPSSNYIRAMLGNYGFTEVSDILRFISVMGLTPRDVCEYTYIRDKLSVCLRNHDNGSEYFHRLWEVQRKIDNYLSVLVFFCKR